MLVLGACSESLLYLLNRPPMSKFLQATRSHTSLFHSLGSISGLSLLLAIPLGFLQLIRGFKMSHSESAMDALNPPSESLKPSPISIPRAISPAPCHRPKFSVAEFETDGYANPSYVHEPEYNRYDANHSVEMTRVVEKDMLDVPSAMGRSRSPSPASFDFRRHAIPEPIVAPPKWPGVARFILRLMILIASPVIVGLLAHSLAIYHQTHNINFSGTEESWPKTLTLFPINLLIAVASISFVASLVALFQSFRSKFSSPITLGDYISIGSSILLIALWIATIVISKQHENSDKADLAWWACRKKSSPDNHMVGYNVICQEQVSTQFHCVQTLWLIFVERSPRCWHSHHYRRGPGTSELCRNSTVRKGPDSVSVRPLLESRELLENEPS